MCRPNIVNCANYGIPQSRHRLVLLASKHGEIELPPPTKKRKTLRDAIGKLPHLSHGEQDTKILCTSHPCWVILIYREYGHQNPAELG